MAAKTLLYTAADETLAPINTYSGENKATKLVVDFSNCGVDTYVKWVRFSNSEPIPLGTAISVEYEIPVAFMARGRLEVQPYAISGTGEVVKFAIRAIPVNRSLEEVDDNTYDPTELEAIQLSFSEIWDAYESGNLGGASAYQVAVNNGFVGTEAEWLLSLKGADGIDGVDGINGTDGIDGANGLDGEDGADGLSAYQVAVNNGFVGTEAEWLLSLVGATGADGQDGSNFTILGQYATLGALQTAHPTGSAGDAWAVGTSESSDLYIWDTVTNSWKDIGQVGINMTADSVTVEDLDENYAGITVEEILAELPSKFSEVTHTHTVSDVTGLVTALAGKAVKPTNEATATNKQILQANGDGTSTYVDFSGGQLLGNSAVKAISYNAQIISENITIPATVNALSAGAITIADGYTVTVEDGAVWVIV